MNDVKTTAARVNCASPARRPPSAARRRALAGDYAGVLRADCLAGVGLRTRDALPGTAPPVRYAGSGAAVRNSTRPQQQRR